MARTIEMFEQSTRQAIKRAASSLGVEVMSRKGRENAERSRRTVLDEYLRLLAKVRGVTLPANTERVSLLARLVGTGAGEGAHIVACLNEVLSLPGDVCECGVGTGATSALLANELQGTGKRLWLYDTFAGLPAPTVEDELIDDIDGLGSMAAYEGQMSHPQVEVQTRLKAAGIATDAYRIVPGLFDQSVAAGHLPDSICFAYIDFDFYAPIKLALEAVSARLSPGGIILVDDYGYFSSGAQAAVDHFLAEQCGRFTLEIPDYCADHFAIVRHVAVPMPSLTASRANG